MSKQTYTTGQVLTSAQMTELQTNDYNQTVSAKVASYVLVASDAGTRITMANASATSITVNTNLFTAGDTLTITNISTGVTTITAGTATVSTAGSLALNQYDSGTLYFTSTGVSIWNGTNPGDITGVTAGTGISGGGTSGTVTVTNAMATEITAAGDIIVGTGSGTFDNLPIGTTAQVLTADTTVSPYKVKWATPASGGGGKVLQVVNATYSTVTNNSTSTFADSGLTATITPTNVTSKVLVLVNQVGTGKDTGNTEFGARLLRGATQLIIFEEIAAYTNTGGVTNTSGACSTCYLDSPATTSATTYKTQFRSGGNTAKAFCQANSGVSTITLLEIGA